jgi:DNA adenine methylase
VVKVVCPVCGELGYLKREKINNQYYLYVNHYSRVDGKIKLRKHYLGKDTSELRQQLEQVIGNDSARKPLRLAGGDYFIADILQPRIEGLCTTPKCTFVEVFGGSGYMSQTVSREVFGNIIYNDIDSLLVTLYRHIKENPEQLAALLTLLPYGRSYYKIVRDALKTNKDFASLTAAALLFYGANSSFLGGFAKKGFAYSIHPNRNEARAFRSRTWAIVKFADKWKDVIIENLDFRDVIRKYDSERTVFYLDPPYPDRSVDYYGHLFTVDDLREMAKLLTEIRGRFLLKLDARTYEPISDILPEGKYKVEKIERKLNQQKARGVQKGTWILTLVSNPPPQPALNS